MNADWEHFLNTVDSRYGLQEPVIKETEEPDELPQEELPKIPEIPASRTVSRKSGNPRRVLAIAAGLALLIVLGFGVWTAVDQFGTRVPENVSVAGVEIGGMKKSQAVKTVKTTLGEPYAARDLVITLPNGELRFSPKETGVTLNADALVADACKQTSVLELQPYLSLNETALRSTLSEYARQLSEQFTPSSYALQGNIPALDEENFDESAPCPKLVLNPGTSGFALDVDNLWNLIQQAYADSSFSVDAQSVVSSLNPDPLDLQTIQEQLGIAPVNARMDTVTHKAVPGSYGLDFDRDEAEKQLRKLQTGEQLEMELHYAAPEIIGQEVYFQDVLGFCQTPHSTNEKRNNNLKLACSVLNGIVLQPGETLSYNDTLGERTAENGYQPAPAYSGTKLVDSIGGGICQVSSTLYLCSLYAELETVERVNHGFPVNYIPYGLDATVSWGKPDLKIKNASQYPVKIVAEVSEDFVRIWIMGTETRDYYVRMGFGSSGSYARSYVCKYDRQTNEQISREQHLLSGYLDEVTSLKGEIGMDEAYITGNVRKQEPCQPTSEALEASREYKQANQHAA